MLAAAVEAPHSAEAVEVQALDLYSTPHCWQLEALSRSRAPHSVGILMSFCITHQGHIRPFAANTLVTLVQLNTLCGNLSVQCHLSLAIRDHLGVDKNSTI